MTLFDSLPPETRERVGIVPEDKAAVGPGVAMIQFGTPLSAFSRSPQKLMREAQAAYHQNPWIHVAEATVTRRVVGLPWHVEDEANEEMEDAEPTGVLKLVSDLIEKPQALLPNVGRRMTRRDLWALTSRHLGLCGMAYWYLDQRDPTSGFPSAIVYVNPARVWPVEDAAGNLTGWVVDPKDDSGRGGTPLELGELVPFYLDPPDFGHLGTGMVEVAGLKAKITDLADKHAAFVLGTGGRLAGIVSPKDGILNDDQYQRLVREFRNVAEAPDAAKRMTIMQGPIDYTQTAATPGELALLDLSRMNRDDILAIWGVPPSMAAVPQSSGGLNSGETRKYDEATLMQGAVHDRVLAIKETIQYQILDRLAVAGVTADLEIEEPEFDDELPMYELAAKARDLPLTNKERRELIGLDPFGKPELDEAVWLPVGLTEAYPGSNDGPSLAPEPVAPVPPEPLQTLPQVSDNAALQTAAENEALPAKAAPFAALRKRLDRVNIPAMQRAVDKMLAEQRDEIVGWIRAHEEHVASKPGDTSWWNDRKWDKRLADALRPFYVRTAETVHSGVAAQLGGAKKADPMLDSVRDRIIRLGGARITGINDWTRERVQAEILAAIAEGVTQGDAPLAIADRVAESAAFEPYRAERIARTESMWAYNSAAIESYREFDVQYVEAIDGDQDEECAERNGLVLPLDEALAETEREHPNGTLDWSPVIDYAGKADDVNEGDVRRIVAEMTASKGSVGTDPTATVTMPIYVTTPPVQFYAPEAPAPVVVNQVTVPEQKAASVTVNVPEQAAPVVNVTMPEQKASTVQDIRIIGQPMVRHTVLRDKAGQMIGSVEEPVE